MQSSTQINATKARMYNEVLALRAKSIFFKTLKRNINRNARDFNNY